VVRIVIAIALLAGLAHADPDAATALRDANTAATTADWAKVVELTDPLLARPLAPAELAEAHRLAGIAAFYQQRLPDAEAHFLAYLKAEPDARLDPALVPPEAVEYFNSVASKYRAQLRALKPKPKRSIWLNLVPVAGQFQNGERGKGIVLGALLGSFVVANVTTYFVLRSWCNETSANGRTGATCDSAASDHYQSASKLRTVNLVTGIGAIAIYVFGVYDGVTRYREITRELSIQPYATTNSVGIQGRF